MPSAETLYDHRIRIKKVMLHINRNLEERCDLPQLSEIAYLSPFHFLRVFEQLMGETPQQYTVRKRMERAGYLLMKRKERITDIAHLVGYQTSSSFNKIFKTFTGQSPRRFRDSISEEWYLKTNRSFHPASGYQVRSRFIQNPALVDLPEIYAIYLENRGIVDASFYKTASATYQKFKSEIVQQDLDHTVQALIGMYPFRFIDLEDGKAVSYCGAIVDKRTQPTGELVKICLPPGKYAVFNHFGPFEFLMQTWNAVYLNWIPKSKLPLRDSIPFEKYLRSSTTSNIFELSAQIFLPVF